jgi:cysteine-rich repeat protein
MVPDPTPTTCGDGWVDATEECDDGNTADGDGCSMDCGTVEDGYLCRGEPSSCRPSCGTSLRVGEAVCQISGGAGCSPPQMQLMRCTAGSPPSLVAEGGCFAPGSDCSNRMLYCGDGWIDDSYGEECDDGNTTAGDGCGADCQIEGGYVCYWEPSRCGLPCMHPDTGAMVNPRIRACVMSTSASCAGYQQPICDWNGAFDYAGAGCFTDAACTM